MTVHEAIAALCNFYDFANDKLFHMAEERPQITIQTKGKMNAYGWFVTSKCWKENDKQYYEINICAEYLDRPIREVAATLIHEMVHYLNVTIQKQDCSRGTQYHNKIFKEAAEAHGLTVTKENKIGWGRTSLNEEGTKVVNEAIANGIIPTNSISLNRITMTKEPGKKTHIRKYVCPKCGAIIRASKEVNVICEDCDEKFIEEI